MICGELHVSRKVRDRESIAFFLLDLGDVGAAILLLVHNPAKELFEDWKHEGTVEGDLSPSKLTSTDKWNVRCVYKSLTLLTKYVGFDSQREVCVISKDVNSFGDGDVLKVLTIDFHDLKQDGGNGKMLAVLSLDQWKALSGVNKHILNSPQTVIS